MPHRHRRLQSVPRVLARLLLPVLGAAFAACSHQSAETARQLELMNERLLILQNDRDRLVERVDALEVNATASSREVVPAREATPTRAPLKVVKLIPSPENEQTAADAQAGPGAEGAASEGVALKGATGGVRGETAPASAVGSNAESESTVVLFGEGAVSGVRSRETGEQP